MNPKEELEELFEFKRMIEMRIFQKFIMEPLKKKMEKMKGAYDCGSYEEMLTLKGEAKGLKFLIGLLKEKETDTKNKKTEIENTES